MFYLNFVLDEPKNINSSCFLTKKAFEVTKTGYFYALKVWKEKQSVSPCGFGILSNVFGETFYLSLVNVSRIIKGFEVL